MTRYVVLLSLAICSLASCVPQTETPTTHSTSPEKWDSVQDRVYAVPRIQGELDTLLEEHLGPRSESYKSAVRTIFAQQILFCDGTDRPERVEVIWNVDEDGQTVIELESPGRCDYGDTLPAAMTLRDGAVVGLTFRVDSNIDSCPCNGWENPEYLDDDLMEVVSRIDTLKSLELLNSNVTDRGFRHIVQMKQLRSLRLWETQLTAVGLAHLAELSELEKLDLSSARSEFIYPPEVCREVARCSQLRDLHLGPAKLTVEALHGLASLRHLEQLNLGGAPLATAGLAAFEGHPTLSKLSLGATNAGDVDIPFPKLPNLKHLSLTIRATAIQIDINDLPMLEVLGVTPVVLLDEENADAQTPDSNDATERVATRLTIARLDSLKDMSLCFGRPTGADWLRATCELSQLPMLASMTLFSEDGVPTIDGDLPSMKMLTVFSRRQPAKVFPMLCSMPNLEQLKLYRPNSEEVDEVPFSDIAPLFELKNLKIAQLTNLQCEDGFSFESFLALPRLSELTLLGCQFADQLEMSGHTSLEHIRFDSGAPRAIVAKDLPNLERFTVVGSNQFHSAQLIRCPSLQSCWCTNTPLLRQLDLTQADLRDPSALDVTLSGGMKESEIVLIAPQNQETVED